MSEAMMVALTPKTHVMTTVRKKFQIFYELIAHIPKTEIHFALRYGIFHSPSAECEMTSKHLAKYWSPANLRGNRYMSVLSGNSMSTSVCKHVEHVFLHEYRYQIDCLTNYKYPWTAVFMIYDSWGRMNPSNGTCYSCRNSYRFSSFEFSASKKLCYEVRQIRKCHHPVM